MPVLIDADILAHQVALETAEYTDFGDDMWVHWGDAKVGRKKIDEAISRIIETTNQDEAILCLSGKNNFRLTVCDSYKSNRAGKQPPMLLKPMKDYMVEEWGATIIDGLEGDDVIGILATGKHKDDHVIFSMDKDLKTIPGRHWSDWRHSANEGCCITITPEEAQRFFFSQVLTGDVTDGYKGCPGVGQVGAKKILSEDCSWDAVVRAYAKAGLDEPQALVQARLAFILHDTHYVNGKPVLWAPEG